MKDTYAKNYKMLMKEIKQMEIYTMFLNQENQYCENLRILPKVIYIFNAIPIQLPMEFFQNQNKKFYTLFGNPKDPKQAKQL